MTEQKDPLELDYTPEKVKEVKKLASKSSRMILKLISGFVILFVIWASFFSMDEVIRGQARVIPSKETQVIDSLEGGIIKDIKVEAGQLVEPGQILLTIDKTIVGAEFKGSKEQFLNLTATAARLKAQIDGKEFEVPQEVQDKAPHIAAQAITNYQERVKQIQNQTEIAEDQIIQKQKELEVAKSQIINGKVTLKLLKEELALISPLVSQELISKRDVLRLKRDIQDTEGKVQTAEINIPRLEAAIQEAQNRKEQIEYEFKVQDADRLQEIKVRLAEAQSRMTTAHDKLTRTELKSPLKGIVKDVKVKTVGGAVQPGEDLIEIVPHEDTLLIEARISPADVGFLHPGLKAVFKVSSYDYSIYGGLEAQVVDVSADTLEDKTINPPQTYYRVFLRTNTNHLTYKGKDLSIMPGMNGEIDIVTGEHTIMKYLLKPIIKGLSGTFGER